MAKQRAREHGQGNNVSNCRARFISASTSNGGPRRVPSIRSPHQSRQMRLERLEPKREGGGNSLLPKTKNSHPLKRSSGALGLLHPLSFLLPEPTPSDTFVIGLSIEPAYIESNFLSSIPRADFLKGRMKRPIRTLASPRVAMTLLALFVTAASATLEEDESEVSGGSSYLRSRKYEATNALHGRRLEEPAYNGEVEIQDFFVYGALLTFIMALAFPAFALTLCKTCPTLCCGIMPQEPILEMPDEEPPAEICSVQPGKAGCYQFMNDVSSFSCGSDRHGSPVRTRLA